jgi:hypothetical protein
LVTAYLDTCIVSGVAKGDLRPEEEEALLKLLQARKHGAISLVTSSVAKDEIDRIPPQHRVKHEMIYNLLNDVPVAQTHRTDSGLMLLGVGGGRCADPLLRTLKGLLPDEADALHLFQAAKNGVTYFLTTDQRTILKHYKEVEAVCNVRAVSPVQLANLVFAASSGPSEP